MSDDGTSGARGRFSAHKTAAAVLPRRWGRSASGAMWGKGDWGARPPRWFLRARVHLLELARVKEDRGVALGSIPIRTGRGARGRARVGRTVSCNRVNHRVQDD